MEVELKRVTATFDLHGGIKPALVDEIRAHGAHMMGESAVPEGLRYAAGTIIEEICTNIIEHSKAEWLELGIQVEGDDVQIYLTDDGAPFDPTQSPTWNATEEDLQGSVNRHLGLYMVHRLSSSFLYSREPSGLNFIQAVVSKEGPAG